MDLFCVSIFDSAASAFGRPAFVSSKGAAVRSFADEVNRVSPDNVMNNHPADFSLYYVGSFSDATAEWSLPMKAELLARGLDVLISRGAGDV